MTATYTNTSTTTVFFQGLRYRLTATDGSLVEEDTGLGRGGGFDVGPGRRVFVEVVADSRDLPASAMPRCALLDPNVHPEGWAGGTPFDARDLTLSGCRRGAELTVRNPTRDPIAVHTSIEFFDSSGYSLGQYDFDKIPRTYSDGRPDDPAVAPRATTFFVIGRTDGIWWGDLPAAVSCEVTGSTYTRNPDPSEVIVD